jgi:hypothetical protein
MADQVNKYRLWCITEEAYVEGWGETAPTVCYNNNTHTIDVESLVQLDSVSDSDVIIKSSEINLPVTSKGFDDLTGHNFYKIAKRFVCQPGKDNIFMEKFSSNLYLAGGGYCVPEKIYQSGEAVVQKPEDGDYIGCDIADIDNIFGYGKTASVSKVERTSNVVTITTAASHAFIVGEKVCVDCNDDSFDAGEAAITEVPSGATFKYSQTGEDISEKDASGTVGKIVVLGVFVSYDFIWAGKEWELITRDAKMIPAGVYMRYKYHSAGLAGVIAYVWYNMRT